MASSSGSDQPVTWLEYSEPRCCQCSQQSKCSRDEYCACHSKHVHCTNCLADSCTNQNILLGPAVEVHVPLCHHPPPQVRHGTLPTHLPPEVWSSQRPAPLPPPSLAYDDISSWNRVVQSAPLRSSFNTSGNQATPSPHQPMLVSHSGGQTEYILYPSLSETVSGSQSSSSSPAQFYRSWNQVTTLPSPNVSVVQPETLVRYFNPSSSPLSPQGMQIEYTRSQVAPVHPTGNRTIVLPHQSSWTQVAGSQSTRPQQLHVDPAYTQDSLFQLRSHTTPAVSRTVLARAPNVQATHLQPSSSQVGASPNQDTPLTSKVSAVTSSDHRETLVSPLSSHIILSGRSTFPQSATPSLSSGEKEGESSVHDAQFVSSDAAITGASTHRSDKSITSSPASKR
ncbi:uncharacterized protein [Littorina saxatilis]|uniref:uncharacterized protein n=1 Tax=Littorina saxatilis TaxID=31220 RepID=UPI0038B48236